MDFAIEPLPINDGAHTVSKISALWGMLSAAAIFVTGLFYFRRMEATFADVA